jgi:hypothetical protein
MQLDRQVKISVVGGTIVQLNAIGYLEILVANQWLESKYMQSDSYILQTECYFATISAPF